MTGIHPTIYFNWRALFDSNCYRTAWNKGAEIGLNVLCFIFLCLSLFPLKNKIIEKKLGVISNPGIFFYQVEETEMS